MPKVFISHSSQDRYFVESKIIPVFARHKIDYWYSKRDLKSAAQWEREIRTGLERCDWLLLVLSPNSVASRWVKAEVDWAVEHRWGKIEPILLEECDPEDLHLMLPQLQYVDFHADETIGEGELDEWAGRLEVKPPPNPAPTVIAVMGTRGGCGKSTIIAAMAQLMASAGHNVAIIDNDLVTSGVGSYLGGWAHSKPSVWTILDAAYARHSGSVATPEKDLGVWDVTPESLRGEERFGHVYLVPARLERDSRRGFQAIANLQDTNPTALSILRETIDRLRHLQSPIHCILVDCGADDNPMVSAAFVIAKHGFLVSHPNPAWAKTIPRLEQMHRENFPDAHIGGMKVIINMATPNTMNQWGAHYHFIPYDRNLRIGTTEGKPVDFMEDFKGIGLNRFFLAVLNVLRGEFDSADHNLLPDEVGVFIRPYLQAMRTFPESMLGRPRYRFASILTTCIVIASLLITGFAATRYVQTNRSTLDVTTRVEIYLSQGSSMESIRDEWSALTLPPELAKKISLTGNQLIIHGDLGNEEMDRLRRAVTSQPVLYALSEGAHRNRKEMETLSFKKDNTKRLYVLLVGSGLALLAWGISFGASTRARIRLLTSVIRNRSDGRAATSFIEELLAKGKGRPKLAWLQKEFREYRPSLIE